MGEFNESSNGVAEAEFVTVAEVARILGIGTTSAYAAVRAGEIPGTRIGSRWIVARRVIDQMIENAVERASKSGFQSKAK